MNLLKSRLARLAAGALAVTALAFAPALTSAVDEPDDICYGSTGRCDNGGALTWTPPPTPDDQGWTYTPADAYEPIPRYTGGVPDPDDADAPDLIHVHYYLEPSDLNQTGYGPTQLSFERPATDDAE